MHFILENLVYGVHTGGTKYYEMALLTLEGTDKSILIRRHDGMSGTGRLTVSHGQRFHMLVEFSKLMKAKSDYSLAPVGSWGSRKVSVAAGGNSADGTKMTADQVIARYTEIGVARPHVELIKSAIGMVGASLPGGAGGNTMAAAWPAGKNEAPGPKKTPEPPKLPEGWGAW